MGHQGLGAEEEMSVIECEPNCNRRFVTGRSIGFWYSPTNPARKGGGEGGSPPPLRAGFAEPLSHPRHAANRPSFAESYGRNH
jgi:hypothetical protein